MVGGAEQRRPFGWKTHGFVPHLERIAGLFKGHLIGTRFKGRKRGGGKTAIQDDREPELPWNVFPYGLLSSSCASSPAFLLMMF